MRVFSFFSLIHVDRFADLALLIGSHGIVVEPHSMGEDNTVEVYFTGEAQVASRLYNCLNTINYIMSTAPVFEDTQ